MTRRSMPSRTEGTPAPARRSGAHRFAPEIVAVVVCAAVLAHAPIAAAPGTAARAALELQATGSHAEAVAMIERERRDLAPTSRGDAMLLGYTLGQLYADQAARTPADRVVLLDRAILAYRKVLEIDAADAATTSALARVLVRQDRAAAADSVLDRWLENASGPSVAVLALQLGDLRRDRQQPSAALAAYRTARAASPESETPWRRITEVMAMDAKSLTAWTDTLRQQYPKLTEFAYRLMLVRFAGDAAAVERTFLRWVEFAAAQGRPGDPVPEDVSILPEPRRQLVAFVAAPSAAPPWWRESGRRRDALAAVCLSLGRIAVRSNPALAARCWTSGLSYAPHYEEVVHGPANKAPVFRRLEILTELAALYDREGTLDPKGEGLGEIIAEMFHSKGAAYERGDLDAIQRHHTVLGVIYASRGVWTSAARAQNAMFQLEHALRIAGQREKSVGYQPLPELKSYLADGYQSVGNRERAVELRLAAAQAFLDTDNARDADSELDTLVHALPQPSPQTRAAIETLRQIVAVRRDLTRLLRADAASALGGLREIEGAKPGWLFEGKATGLAHDFVARQRFKTYSDMSTVSAAGGEQERAARYALKAVEETGKAPPIGPADVVRLRRLERQTKVDLSRDSSTPMPYEHHLDVTPPSIPNLNPPTPPDGQMMKLHPNLPVEVQLNARIREDERLSSVAPSVRVAGDSVVVMIRNAGAAAEPDLKQYVEGRLKGLIDGRRLRVAFRPRSP